MKSQRSNTGIVNCHGQGHSSSSHFRPPGGTLGPRTAEQGGAHCAVRGRGNTAPEDIHPIRDVGGGLRGIGGQSASAKVSRAGRHASHWGGAPEVCEEANAKGLCVRTANA